ncbi:MAG: hypothetical protein LBH28_02630, partial [Oscillospiraceae bacterium]|nr:hypothetical protein [Oscillospiraceae bacterium]
MKKPNLAKIICGFLALPLLAAWLTSCSGGDSATVADGARQGEHPFTSYRPPDSLEKHTIQFRGRLADSDTDEFPYYADIEISWGWELFGGSAAEYSNDLAIAGLALSSAAENTEAKTEEMLSILGFDGEKTQSYDYYTSFFEMQKVAHTFAYQNVRLDQKQYNVFAIVNRGTHDASDYMTDGLAVFGAFEIAAMNTLSDFAKFMSASTGKSLAELQDEENIFFITGHSLGGAVGNVIARQLFKFASSEKIFAYTYASPRPALVFGTNAENIFNIINLEDLVPNLPPFFPGRAGVHIFFSRKD